MKMLLLARQARLGVCKPLHLLRQAGSVVLFFGMHNLRLLELIVFMLCALIAIIFAYELGEANPDWGDVGKGFIPKPSIITSELALP